MKKEYTKLTIDDYEYFKCFMLPNINSYNILGYSESMSVFYDCDIRIEFCII